jgi:hypothetical protein
LHRVWTYARRNRRVAWLSTGGTPGDYEHIARAGCHPHPTQDKARRQAWTSRRKLIPTARISDRVYFCPKRRGRIGFYADQPSPPECCKARRKKGVLTKAMGCSWQPDPSFKSPYSFFLKFSIVQGDPLCSRGASSVVIERREITWSIFIPCTRSRGWRAVSSVGQRNSPANTKRARQRACLNGFVSIQTPVDISGALALRTELRNLPRRYRCHYHQAGGRSFLRSVPIGPGGQGRNSRQPAGEDQYTDHQAAFQSHQAHLC